MVESSIILTNLTVAGFPCEIQLLGLVGQASFPVALEDFTATAVEVGVTNHNRGVYTFLECDELAATGNHIFHNHPSTLRIYIDGIAADWDPTVKKYCSDLRVLIPVLRRPPRTFRGWALNIISSNNVVFSELQYWCSLGAEGHTALQAQQQALNAPLISGPYDWLHDLAYRPLEIEEVLRIWGPRHILNLVLFLGEDNFTAALDEMPAHIGLRVSHILEVARNLRENDQN